MHAGVAVHVVGGGIALLSGVVAASAAKGGTLHRRSGMIFVYSMFVMTLTGTVMGMVLRQPGNAIGGLLTLYLVTTAWTTVRPPSTWTSRVDFAALIVGLATAIAGVLIGAQVAASPTGMIHGVPGAMIIINGSIALLGVIGDIRMKRVGRYRGMKRLRRHFWRMGYALFVASGSFFIGQAEKFPEPLRIGAVIYALGFGPLVLLFFWFWRFRGRPGPVLEHT